jgi:hypothetical protein
MTVCPGEACSTGIDVMPDVAKTSEAAPSNAVGDSGTGSGASPSYHVIATSGWYAGTYSMMN